LNLLIISTADLQGIGGLAVRYRELSKAIGRMNNKVFFISVTSKDARLSSPECDNVHLCPINMSVVDRLKTSTHVAILWQWMWALLFNLKCLMTMVKICGSKKIDACVSFTAAADPLIYFVSRLFHIFWVYDVRGLSEIELPKLKMIDKTMVPLIIRLEHFCSKRADKVLVVSEHMKEAIVNLRNLCPSKVSVSEDGVDLTAFNPIVHRGLFRSCYKIPEDDPIILYLGSVSMAKGIDRVIKAMPSVLEECPNAKLVIVGGGGYAVDDSKLLRAMVNDLGLGNNVIFTGRVEHSAPFIMDANICVAPSSLYFSPIKVYEYLACAKPVVVDKNVDIAELLVTNEAGVIADTTDPFEFASVIVRLLRNKNFSQKISLHGYRIILDNFTWEIIAKKLIKLVESEFERRNLER